MSSEESLIEVRQTKHQELNGKTYPLPSAPTSMHFIDNVLFYIWAITAKTSIDPNELGNMILTMHGRITAFRKTGAITFLKITDVTGSIQIIASRASLESYNNLRLLDLGDLVEIKGKPCHSKTGERSILMTDWTLLAKAHRPPPEKWQGISNDELKLRKRYLDLMSSEETRALFIVRSYTLRAIRNFFEKNHFIEVETSTLNSVNSGANAKPFTTHHNALDTDLFLRIAPELYLKRLIVGGMDRVFEIGRNYRNEGISPRHNPEFTMLEYYQAYGVYKDLLLQTKALLQSIDVYLAFALPKYVQEYYYQCKDNRTFTFDSFVEVSMKESVVNALSKIGYTIGDDFTNLFMIAGVTEEQKNRRSQIDFTILNKELSQTKTVGNRLSILFEYIVEPFLTLDYRTEDKKYSCPVFITEYPKEICPLARANDNDPSVCDRFELFVDGRELCNAFQELNDPDEQALRFREQLQNNDKDPMDFDHDYIEALQQGMPPVIGFGAGIERLIMLLTNASSIKNVILFPTLKPNK